MSRYYLVGALLLCAAAAILLVPGASAQTTCGTANDCFGAAATIAQPSYQNVSNVGMAMQPGEPQPCAPIGASMWYKFTAMTNGTAVISTTAAFSSVDSVLGVYTGVNISTLSLVACNDDRVGLQAELVFTCVTGTTYYVQLAGYLGDTGTMALTASTCGGLTVPSAPKVTSVTPSDHGNDQVIVWWDPPVGDGGAPLRRYLLSRSIDGGPETVISISPYNTFYTDSVGSASVVTYRTRAENAIGTSAYSAPASLTRGCFYGTNDCFASATDLGTQRPADFTASTVGKTLEEGEPMMCGGAGKTTWYKFTAQTEGVAHVRSRAPATAWSMLSIYTGTGFDNMPWVACTSIPAAGTGERSFDCVIGRTYYIQVASAIGTEGSVPLRLEGCGAPVRSVGTRDPVVVKDHEWISTKPPCNTTVACSQLKVDADTRVSVDRSPSVFGGQLVDARVEVKGTAAGRAVGSGEVMLLIVGPPPPPPGPGPGGTPTIGQIAAYVDDLQQWASSVPPSIG